MKHPLPITRLIAWLAALVLLHGCAAATVIQKQPDFNDENERRLKQNFQKVKLAEHTPEVANR
jgi:hypothetical protein